MEELAALLLALSSHSRTYRLVLMPDQTQVSLLDSAASSGVDWNGSVRTFVQEGSLNGSLAEALATLCPLSPEGWMREFTSIYPGRSLHDLCLLGAHHAGMYRAERTMLAREESTLTQRRSIYHQLRGGVRFLELRLLKDDGEISAYHGAVKGRIGAIGPRLSELLDDVSRFLGEERGEVVVVMFKDLVRRGRGNHTSEDAILEVARDVSQVLSDRSSNLRPLLRRDAHLVDSTSLQNLQKAANLIAILEDDVPSSQLPEDVLGRGELKMVSTYTKKPKLGDSDVRRYNRSKSSSGFHERVTNAFDKTEREGHRTGRVVRMQLEVRRSNNPVNGSSIRDLASYANEHAAERLPGRLNKWRVVNAKESTSYEAQHFANVYFTDLSHEVRNFRASQSVNRILSSKAH